MHQTQKQRRVSHDFTKDKKEERNGHIDHITHLHPTDEVKEEKKENIDIKEIMTNTSIDHKSPKNEDIHNESIQKLEKEEEKLEDSPKRIEEDVQYKPSQTYYSLQEYRKNILERYSQKILHDKKEEAKEDKTLVGYSSYSGTDMPNIQNQSMRVERSQPIKISKTNNTSVVIKPSKETKKSSPRGKK